MATLLLAITGSIAVYKVADLASKLTQAGHDVRVVMSQAAQQLVQPSTFLNVTGNKVFTDLWDPDGQTQHIALTDEADLAILAPATANSIAKLALGLGDDMVSTTLLALGSPLLVCPAMNTRMWRNPAVQQNLATLRARGAHVLAPGSGNLACGHAGPGRLAEPVEIAAEIERLLAEGAPPVVDEWGEGEDPLLPRLLGEWQLEGEVRGHPLRQRVSGSVLYAGRFLRLTYHPSETLGLDGRPYAAEATLGYDAQAGRYVMQLVDVFGAGPAAVVGFGQREGSELCFRFAYSSGEFETRLTWRADEEGWDLSLTSQSSEGSWVPFATKRLRR